MSEFTFQLGRRNAKSGSHVEPLGLRGPDLDDWKKGHGPGWIARSNTAVGSQVEKSSMPTDSSISSSSNLPAYTPFSTSKTKRLTKTGRTSIRERQRPDDSKSRSVARDVRGLTPPGSPKPEACRPKPVMGLFGPIDDEILNAQPRPKPPSPIPKMDRDRELEKLQCIGIAQSAAVELIEADWTIDQLRCRWQLNDWSKQPKFVQEVQAIVTAHCEQSWPSQNRIDMEV